MNHKSLMVVYLSIILITTTLPIASSNLHIEENNTIALEDIDGDHLNITENPKWQMRSSIHGNNIVWQDYRDDPYGTWSSPGYRDSNIYLYNILHDEVYQITTDNSSQVRPDIWENYVVWEDYRNDQADIYYADITDLLDGGDIEVNQLTDDSSDQIKPKIHNGRVVWEDYRENYLGDIFLYELMEDRGPYRINTRDDYGRHDSIPNSSPNIYDDKIVWTDYRQHWDDTKRGDIYLYDLNIDSNENGIPNYRDEEIGEDDPAEMGIADENIHQHSPSIYKETVVWTEYDETRNNDIYMKKFGENSMRISEGEMKDDNPIIYGESIVYQKREYDDEGSPISDSIWFYNIHQDTHERIIKISTDPGHSSRVKTRFPAIYQNKIVWEENHPSDHEDIDHQYDIFYTEIEPEEVVIRSTSVANETMDFDDSTEMILTEGSELNFRAEIRDPMGLIENVSVGTSSITGVEDDLEMDETEQGIYEGTLEYSIDMQEEFTNITFEVWDSEDYIESDPMEIRFIEPVLEFSSVGVGTEQGALGDETRFVIEDGASLFFEADLEKFKGEIESVFVDVTSFGIEETEFDLNHIEEGTYRYEYTYTENDEISTGENDVRFYALGDRGQQTESDELTVDIVFKPPEPKIEFYGVGKDRSNLYDSIDFELTEDNYVYFVVTVDQVEDVSYNVYLNISELGTGEDRVEMVDMVDENTYYYRLEYSEDLEAGEKGFHITVEDEFDQEEKSEDVHVNFVNPEESLPLYYYLIPIALAIILIIVILYMKKPELFTSFKTGSDENPEQ
ncbi:MAG: hypothetical protein R6W73_01265 [Candidatus Saliniplasma sp.]